VTVLDRGNDLINRSNGLLHHIRRGKDETKEDRNVVNKFPGMFVKVIMRTKPLIGSKQIYQRSISRIEYTNKGKENINVEMIF
jgi:hypothetical protein